MAQPGRGSLTDMAVPKVASVTVGTRTEAVADAVVQPKVPTPRRSPADLKTVQVRINKKGWKALRDLAADNETSLEALMVEALNDVLLKNQRSPIVERRSGERGTERGE